jgi:hypothetical protein
VSETEKHPHAGTADAPISPEQEAPDPTAPVAIAAGPQSAAAVTPREAPTATPNILSGDERALLTAVLNGIIPPGDGKPGAGEIGVAATIERTMAASAPLRRLFRDGLIAIDVASAREHSNGTQTGFAGLDAGAQLAVLRAIEQDLPTFFAALVDHTYRGYYTDPQVYAAIEYDHRPPQPLGHYLPPFDPALLERQRTRAPFWRQTS